MTVRPGRCATGSVRGEALAPLTARHRVGCTSLTRRPFAGPPIPVHRELYVCQVRASGFLGSDMSSLWVC